MTGGVGAREGARGVVRGLVVVVEIDRGDRGRARGGGMKARVRAPRRLGGGVNSGGWKNLRWERRRRLTVSSRIVCAQAGAARKGKGRSSGLSEEQKQEIREAFDLFDTEEAKPLTRRS